MDALQTLREMSDVELSRRSGVSRSTLHRIETGATSPTLRTLRELAIAAGVDIDVSIKTLSDTYAARGARFLLDASFQDVPLTRQDREWMERLARVSGDDPVALVSQAGHASTVLAAPNAVFVRGSFAPLRLASAGEAADGPWAVSGRVGLDTIADRSGTVPVGADILYVADPHHAWRLLESPPTIKTPDSAGTIIAPWHDHLAVDAWEVGAVRYVAPIQVLLDCVGLGGEVAEAALDIARRW
jgi:transcriptional regulator with XRE-family HTH domain